MVLVMAAAIAGLVEISAYQRATDENLSSVAPTASWRHTHPKWAMSAIAVRITSDELAMLKPIAQNTQHPFDL
jgi:hypothetical protein